MMIVQAVEKCGREWRSVAQFMKKHADVLGNTGIFIGIWMLMTRKPLNASGREPIRF